MSNKQLVKEKKNIFLVTRKTMEQSKQPVGTASLNEGTTTTTLASLATVQQSTNVPRLPPSNSTPLSNTTSGAPFSTNASLVSSSTPSQQGTSSLSSTAQGSITKTMTDAPSVNPQVSAAPSLSVQQQRPKPELIHYQQQQQQPLLPVAKQQDEPLNVVSRQQQQQQVNLSNRQQQQQPHPSALDQTVQRQSDIYKTTSFAQPMQKPTALAPPISSSLQSLTQKPLESRHNPSNTAHTVITVVDKVDNHASNSLPASQDSSSLPENKIEQYLCALQQEIISLQNNVQSLHDVIAEIQNAGNIFTAQDLAAVQDVLQEATAQYKAKVDEYNYLHDIHENAVVGMRRMLDARMQLLDDLNRRTQFLSRNEKLLAYFATRHAEMENHWRLATQQIIQHSNASMSQPSTNFSK